MRKIWQKVKFQKKAHTTEKNENAGKQVMESLWRKQTKDIPPGMDFSDAASKGRHRDVIVVGAGLAGLLTAYYLKKQGRDVLVLEADVTASGQTERTTAKITSQHGLKYSQLIKTVGESRAELYAQANEAAVREYERLIREQKIECGLRRADAYLYTTQDANPLRQEAEAAAALGIDVCCTGKTDLPFPVSAALCFPRQAQFQPLEFVRHIAGTLDILEHARVSAIKGRSVIVGGQEWTADDIVIATHYPILNVPGFYFLRQHQERSYVLALSGCGRIEDMYYSIDPGGFSFRQAGDFLLIGGCSHRTGENEQGGAYEKLLEAARQYYPDCKVEARWSAQDCMPHDGIPFIGKYSLLTPHLYVATGFQKWGMTSSMAAAMILSDLLSGKENPYQEVFCPQRINVRAGAGNLMRDTAVSVNGLLKGLCHRPKDSVESLPSGHGGIVTVDGKRYACYKDEEGEIHKISARCPHMGCELAWNPDEKSWDCPCHGSRFDVDGALLDDPAL